MGGCIALAGIAALALRRVGGSAVVGALGDAPNARRAADDAWAIGTGLLVDAAQGAILAGVLLATGAWAGGRGRRATALRRMSSPALREHPTAVRVGLGVAILLLVLWGPVPWTGRFFPVLVLAVAAFTWLEWIRRQALREFPDVPAGEWSRRMRAAAGSVRRPRVRGDDWLANLERLAELHNRGAIDEGDYEREKSALLAGR